MVLKENTKEKIGDGFDAVKIVRACLDAEDEISREREHFYVIGLNVKHAVLYVELCSLGSLTSTLIHPREVFRIAVLKGAASIVAVHTHPSGDPTPSAEDIDMNQKLERAAGVLGIRLLDQLILGDAFYYSWHERRRINIKLRSGAM